MRLLRIKMRKSWWQNCWWYMSVFYLKFSVSSGSQVSSFRLSISIKIFLCINHWLIDILFDALDNLEKLLCKQQKHESNFSIPKFHNFIFPVCEISILIHVVLIRLKLNIVTKQRRAKIFSFVLEYCQLSLNKILTQ